MIIPKYRAWHKHSKQMMPVLEIRLDPESGGVFVEDDYAGHCECHLYKDFWPWSDIELMQCLPQTDMHDQDIYEGDILQIEDATAKVVFWEYPPAFGMDYRHNEDKWCDDWTLSDDCHRMEVIGNVWQHPQLLQSKEP